MSDKKKKKTKNKQRQKQKQSQQVIVNIGGRAAREPRREVRENKLITPIQPPPIVQYLYRDNLALNMLNDRTRAAQQQATTVAATAPQATATTAATPNNNNPPPTATPVQPPPPPNNPPPNKVLQLIQNNKLHKSTSLTPQQAKRNVAFDFDKVLKPPPPPKQAMSDTDYDDDNLPVRTPIRSSNEGFKLTKDGLPYKRNKDYNFIMENYIGNMPPEQRSKKQQQAYESYMNSLTKVSAGDDEIRQPTLPPPPPSSQNTAAVQPVDFDPAKDDDEEELYFFSPLKKKPT